MLNNTTSVGFRGEVAAQILCLAAWQKCLLRRPSQRRLPEFSFPFVQAIEFIKKLVGQPFFDALPEDVRTGLTNDLENAYVRVNQFVKTFDELGLDTLREYFLRASGVYCKEGQQGVDLALGLWFGPDFRESSFSGLLLQIKLKNNGMTLSERKS
jgi:hypothetical protein